MLSFYKDMLSCLEGGELASLLYMYRGSTMEYSKKWCQDALDFAYRMMQSGLIWIAYFDEYDTAEDAKDIFDQMAAHSPNFIEGGAIWSTYQFFCLVRGKPSGMSGRCQKMTDFTGKN